MQKHIATLLLMIFLSGCASFRQAHDDSLAQKKATEEEAWAKLEKLSADHCSVGLQPPEKERAVEISNCVTGLVTAYVLPNAIYPDLLLSSRAEALRLARDYAAGKMSAAEYKARSEKRLINYKSALIYFTHQQIPSSLG